MHLDLNATHLYALIIGLVLGLALFFLAARSLLKTKSEFRRYKKMLSDKLELDQRQVNDLTAERERLLKDNENLRVKVVQLNERADNKLQRELEIYARAEKQMMINAPGFAAAWELAKTSAHTQLGEEERGASLPQRLFRKFLGGGSAPDKNLPADAAKNPAPTETAV